MTKKTKKTDKKRALVDKLIEVEAGYEVEMYKLIAVAAVVVLVSVVLGVFLGKSIGFATGVDAVEINAPGYCTLRETGTQINITCGTELGDATVDELCTALSTSLKQNLKVLLIS